MTASSIASLAFPYSDSYHTKGLVAREGGLCGVAHRRGFSRQRIDFRFWPGREEDVERSASSTLSSQHTNAGMIWLSESDREMEM
jgi:hypothetical protein